MKSQTIALCFFLTTVAVTITPGMIFHEAASLRVASLFFLNLILMVGLHVVTGLTRVVSLTHAALAGVGAYGAAIVALRLDLWPLASIAVGALAAGVIALVLAKLSSSLEEHYLALATLAASEILTNFFRSATPLTGGANGLIGVPPVSVAGLVLDRASSYYPFCAIVGMASLAAVWLLERSPLGKALRAMGDEGPLVESLGVSQQSLRVLGFAVGGVFAGLAGAIAAHVDGFVGPESFGVNLSIGYLCFLVIGGLGHLRGAILGAALASLGAELLRGLIEWQMVILACLALGFLYLRRANLHVRFLPQRFRIRLSEGLHPEQHA